MQNCGELGWPSYHDYVGHSQLRRTEENLCTTCACLGPGGARDVLAKTRKRENGHGSMISRERDNVQISTGWKVGNVQG